MSIELFSGFVGSGKSYAATAMGARIVDAPMGKQHVIANFPLTMTKKQKRKKNFSFRWHYKTNEELTPDYLVQKSIQMGWDKKESSCMVIFDEASIKFNARTFQSSDRMQWIEFLTESRKFGYDVIFITQDARMLDKQIRQLCEYECTHKKLNNMLGFGFLKLFRISLFAQVRYWNGLNNASTKGSLRLFVYKKSVAKRYDTYMKFNKRNAVDGQSGAVNGTGA
jgi:zona occludens toxin